MTMQGLKEVNRVVVELPRRVVTTLREKNSNNSLDTFQRLQLNVPDPKPNRPEIPNGKDKFFVPGNKKGGESARDMTRFLRQEL
eukprot:g76785.t1